MYVFAVIGLALATSGQAQNQTESPQGETDQQNQPAYAPPLPFPVEIVEDQATTDARNRGEEEARQREIADLAAQEGMNAATQAIKAATNDMRDYALYSTIAVWVGTVLLIITLVLGWFANRAAVDAVRVTREVGRDQSRAYIFADWAVAEDRGSYSYVGISFVNSSATPAKWIKVFCSFEVLKSGSTPTNA